VSLALAPPDGGAGAVAGGGTASAAAMLVPALDNGTGSDSDDDVGELDCIEDRAELQELIGREMGFARNERTCGRTSPTRRSHGTTTSSQPLRNVSVQ
jgi:hypothetical protein